ncbi:unnamed protein product [Rhizoctonia solani]|uniref:C2H2-type domain-containing protein n=1 Tax=Rhizoctonia solani TaxID=456999 RepID=A0A8H2WS96_9AGAM|nr:unnamed protein product [Rhizoctonia solani]
MSTAYISSPTSPLTSQLGRLALFSKNTDDRNANYQPISGSDETRLIGESWDSWGDRDVLKIVQSMIDYLARQSSPKSNYPTELEHRAPVAKGVDTTKPFQLRAPQSKQRRSSNDRRHVNPPVSSRKYFVVFPCIYSIDQDRIIYLLDENFQQHQVIPQPLQSKITLSLQGITYWLDENGDLWYKLDHDWFKETFYTEQYRALLEVKRCIENNNLQGAAGSSWIPSPSSSDDSHGNTSSGPSSPTLSIGSDETHIGNLPQLSQYPDQAEIDNWFQQLKRCRAVQAKAGHRLQEVRCPLSKCAKVQRRPQALRDHLYFHYGIKPYKCQFGCQQAFETKANMERHTDTCPIRWGTQ